VAQHLRAAIDYFGFATGLYYWAPAASRETEVDFLLEAGDRFVAIEAKSGSLFHDSWCKGLRAISGLPGLSRRIIVTPGGQPMVTPDGIEAVPFHQLTRMIREGALLPHQA